MNEKHPVSNLESRHVTYTIEVDGRIIVIEHVPARVCVETGEQFFSPHTFVIDGARRAAIWLHPSRI